MYQLNRNGGMTALLHPLQTSWRYTNAVILLHIIIIIIIIARSTGIIHLVYSMNLKCTILVLRKMLTGRHRHGPFSARSEHRGQCCTKHMHTLAYKQTTHITHYVKMFEQA